MTINKKWSNGDNTKREQVVQKALQAMSLGVLSTIILTLTNLASAAQPTINQQATQNIKVKADQQLAIDDDTKQKIADTLWQAGMQIPIASIEPSKLPSMYQVTLLDPTQLPLHITADSKYILQGQLNANPSPKKSTPPQEVWRESLIGKPVSQALRKSILQNTSVLKNITPDVSLYYTAIPGVIWGITFNGQPFITNTAASVFTSGEISVIKDGQFSGLDANFEQQKNKYILSNLDESQLIVYPAIGEEKSVIYVATDINCPYCRIMHGEIDELNAKGITVKVIGYPVYEESPEQMRQIWCETDTSARRSALDEAMSGNFVARQCNEHINNLYQNQALSAGLAVFATPAIYREDGVQFQDAYQQANLLPFLGL